MRQRWHIAVWTSGNLVLPIICSQGRAQAYLTQRCQS